MVDSREIHPPFVQENHRHDIHEVVSPYTHCVHDAVKHSVIAKEVRRTHAQAGHITKPNGFIITNQAEVQELAGRQAEYQKTNKVQTRHELNIRDRTNIWKTWKLEMSQQTRKSNTSL